MPSAHPFLLAGAKRRNTRRVVARVAASAVLLSLLALAIRAFAGSSGDGADGLIVFVHVPAAWLSLALYGAAVASAAALLSGRPALPLGTLAAIAPVGVAAAFLALWTGLTSQQARGAWWGWDARLVCELVLLLLFAAVAALHAQLADAARAARSSSVLVLVGALNIPIIYLSVNWWHGLHERAAATVARSPATLAAMTLMTLAFCLYALAVMLARLEVLGRARPRATRDFETVLGQGGGAPARVKEQR